jgi:hypothetical protein
MPDPKERCNRCMQPAEGFARIGMFRYCHGLRDCYRRQQWDDARNLLTATLTDDTGKASR